MKKSLPPLNNDRDAENFLKQDLSDYLTSENFKPVSFEFLPKTEKVNLRIPAPLLEAVKQRAERLHMPYQKYIRHLMEQDIFQDRP